MKFLCALAIVVIATPAANAAAFECTFDGYDRNQGFIAKKVVVAHDPGNDEATVSDEIILSVHGKPIDGAVVADNDKRLSVHWKIELKSTMNEFIRATYRMTIMRGDLSAKISMQPGSFDNTFQAQGQCRQIKS